MSSKSLQFPPLATESRERFHAIFNQWFCLATETELDQLDNARHRLAPFQICSMVTLVRGCLADQELRTALPESLVQLLREQNWLRPCAVATSA